MEKLNNNEKELFSILKNEDHKTHQLEGQIIEQLKSKKLINSKSFVMKSIFFKTAASILILLSTFYLGRLSIKTAGESNDENLYALFLYENEEFTVKNPNTLVAEYKDWAIDLSRKGLLAYAEKLNENERSWIGSTTIENKQSKLTGYFVYSANNYEEAIQIAKSHPHTNYGGGIEVIAIDEVK